MISAGVSCSPQQRQISSFNGLVQRGTGKDETVSITDAVKCRAQNETLVCTGESTALTGVFTSIKGTSIVLAASN